METAREILQKHDIDGWDMILSSTMSEVIEAMEEYGKLMYNQAIDDAANEALADWTKVYSGIGEDIEVYVIKGSILKLKK